MNTVNILMRFMRNLFLDKMKNVSVHTKEAFQKMTQDSFKNDEFVFMSLKIFEFVCLDIDIQMI